MLSKVLKILLNFKKVYSDLSIIDIQKTVDEVFANTPNVLHGDLTPLKETIANPLFGFFADKLGLNYNIRFFSPYIKPGQDSKNERKFVGDKSSDFLTSIFIQLYPSPAGQLTTSTMHVLNPFNFFTRNKNEFVEFFAKIFIAILRDENSIIFNCIQGNDEIKTNFDNRLKFFRKLEKLFFAKNSNSICEEKPIKLLCIHSYMINILDPWTQGDKEDFFKIYLTEIAKSYKSSGDSKFLEMKIDTEVLQLAVEYYNSMNLFPYSVLNPPQSNKIIPSYIRKDINGDPVGLFSVDERDKFADCADISLLHICNCLFFCNGKYDLTHLPNPSADLKKFYEKFPTPCILTLEIRNEWSKVIQDLNENKKESFSHYPTENILYKKSTNNEIKSGIINMMNVLIKVTGLQDAVILKDINKKNLVERLEFLIGKLSINRKNSTIVNVDLNTINENYTGIKNKKDFAGTFTITFKYPNEIKKTIEVCHKESLCHVEVKLLDKETSTIFIPNKIKILSKLESPGYQNLMFKCFLFPDEKYLKWSDENYFFKIYLGGRIDNNDSSQKILKKICQYIDELEEEMPKNTKTKNFEKILNLILDKVSLHDYDTKSSFKEFLTIKRSAIGENDFSLALLAYAKSLEQNSAFLIKNWEEFFSNEIPEFKKFDLNFNICFFLTNGILVKKVKNLVFNSIHNFINLIELEIDNSHLNEEEISVIFKKIKNPGKIEKLILFNEGYPLPKEIQFFSKLKIINLSNNNLQKIPDIFFKLRFLEKIYLNGNDLSNISPDAFLNFANLETLYIPNTSISNAFLEVIFQIESIKELDVSGNKIINLPENIGNLKNLELLELENTQISDLPFGFTRLKSLEKLNLRGNDFRNLSPYIFSNFDKLKVLLLADTSIPNTFLEPLFEFVNLEYLDISTITISTLPENIRNLKKLIFLDIEYSQIKKLPKELKELKFLKKIECNSNFISEESFNLFRDEILWDSDL